MSGSSWAGPFTHHNAELGGNIEMLMQPLEDTLIVESLPRRLLAVEDFVAKDSVNVLSIKEGIYRRSLISFYYAPLPPRRLLLYIRANFH
jgi:hypothetical protein